LLTPLSIIDIVFTSSNFSIFVLLNIFVNIYETVLYIILIECISSAASTDGEFSPNKEKNVGFIL
jgi:hypothetical protein